MRRAACSRNKGGDVATAGRRDAWINPSAGALAATTVTEPPAAAGTEEVAVDDTASQDAA